MSILLPEIVAVGVYNAQTSSRGREVTRPRKVTMFELELPIGDGGISYTDSESIPIADDMIICAKPGQLRHTRLPFKCYYVHMIVRDKLMCDTLMRMPTYIKIDNREQYESIFSELCACYGTSVPSDEMLIYSNLLKLVHMLSKHTSQGLVTSHASNKAMIEDVIEYIKENPTADLTLDALASRVSFSPVHFHNCFRKSTGKTLRTFVEESRIDRAVKLLLGTDKTLTEIAYECGFSSQSYFSYAFKRKMNMTPREYTRCISLKYEN